MRLQATPRPITRLAALISTASLVLASVPVSAQAPAAAPALQYPALQYQDLPSASAYPLNVDRGSSALWQSLQEAAHPRQSYPVIAHPDDEDGGMLAYETRDLGADTTLLTLNRGEGGQNVMSSDFWDQLGQVRTQELLAATDAFGVAPALHQRGRLRLLQIAR